MAYKPQNFENGNALSAEELNYIEQGIVELEQEVGKKQPIGNYIEEETDPTVPEWAKKPTKPTYTADEVGAESEGTAEKKVSGHNANTEAHNDIRLLIERLNTRLNALADSDDITLDQMSELVAYIKSNRNLIEEVTTNKVNVSDIIDNLATNVATKPLSAAQGVVLKGLIDALSQNKLSNSDVVNNLTTYGGNVPLAANQGRILKEYIDELESDKADKATTLAGYGITDGVKKDTFKDHTSDTAIHITAEERTAWNAKADTSSIPTKTSQLTNDSGFLKAVPDEYVTEEELEDKGYLTDVPSEYVTEEELEDKGYLTGVPSDYPTYEALNNRGYMTEAKLNLGLYPIVKTVNNIKPDANGNIDVVGGDGTINYKPTWDDLAVSYKDLVITSDDVNYGGYHKVSDEAPTIEQLQKGGTISFNEGGNGIVTKNYPEGDMAILERTDGAVIAFNGLPLAVVAFEDGMSYFGNTFEKGIHFTQDDIVITHSLTIIDYVQTDEINPIPVEYLPKSHQFGETKVMSDTITWDGNTDGLYSVLGMFYKVSDTIPTLADLQNGGILSAMGEGQTFTSDNVMDLEDLGAGSDCIVIMINGSPNIGIALKEGATATLQGVTAVFEETGIFFIKQAVTPDMYVYISRLTINGYTGFETTEIKTIDAKYIEPSKTRFYVKSDALYLDEEETILATPQDVKEAFDKGQIIIREGTWDNFALGVVLVTYPLSVSVGTNQKTYTVGLAD